jgi:hypothetical protein
MTSQVESVLFESSEELMGPDWTDLAGGTDGGLHVVLEGRLEMDAPQGELLILLENRHDPLDPLGSIRINGETVTAETSGSRIGWAADGPPGKLETGWLFRRAPLATGKNTLQLDLLTRDRSTLAVWALAYDTIQGVRIDHPEGLPAPERINRDAIELLPPIALSESEVSVKPATFLRPIERVEGVYLDTLDRKRIRIDCEGLKVPIALDALDTSRWITEAARWNRNLNDNSLNIGGRHYLRGLGTRAPSIVTIELEGEYERFQSWVGLDSELNTHYCDRSIVHFQIRADGRRIWESGPVAIRQSPLWVDLDIAGAQTLELEAKGDQPTEPFYADHWIDWAAARLIGE